MKVHPSLAGGVLDKSALDGLGSELAFPAEEYRQRIAKLRAAMSAAGLDVLLAHHPGNVVYLSGYQTFSVLSDECAVVPAAGEPRLVVPPPELGTALLHTWLDCAYGFAREQSAGAYLAASVREMGFESARLGIDRSTTAITPRCLTDLSAGLPQATIVDASDLVESVRAVKSPREIECLRAAAPMTDAGMTAAIAQIAPGKTDNDVAAAAIHAMTLAGSEYVCDSPIVTSGRRSGILHSTHKRVALEPGDPVCIELGACYQRYTAALMRTASLGPPSPGVQRLADACLNALDTVLSTLRAGLTGHEVAEPATAAIAAAGEDLVFHRVFGYGVGASFPPTWGDRTGLIRLGEHAPIRAGMVFHHPVALRRLGQYGVMFSETTVVTETGCEPLGTLDRELFVV